MSKRVKKNENVGLTKKSLVAILILSVIVTIAVPVIAFLIGNYKYADGFPFKWSRFNFLGSNTDYGTLMLDIAFWFLVIWGIWKLFPKLFKKR